MFDLTIALNTSCESKCCEEPHRAVFAWRYQELPKDLIPPQFFERNGYQVLAYRTSTPNGRRKEMPMEFEAAHRV